MAVRSKLCPGNLLLAFGVVTDTHWRYDPYAGYPARLTTALAEIDAAGCTFVMFMGDIVHGDVAGYTEANCITFFSEFRSDAGIFTATPYYALGNHEHVDGYSAAQDIAWWLTSTGMPNSYYSFVAGGVECLVIHDDNYHPWDTSQSAWLTAKLSKSASPVVIFDHTSLVAMTCRFPGYPAPNFGASANAAAILAILEASPRVKAVIYGHNHAGAQVKKAGINHFICRSLWDDSGSGTPAPNTNNPTPEAYRSIVRVYDNGRVTINERIDAIDLR